MFDLDIEVKFIERDNCPIVRLQYATPGSAGLDLIAHITKSIVLLPNHVQLIPTGVAIFIKDIRYTGMIIPRSGKGHKHGLILGNGTGLIDSDYQGELMVSLWNRSESVRQINPGDKIAQYIIVPVKHARLNVVEKFSSETARGNNGFGHSDDSHNARNGLL